MFAIALCEILESSASQSKPVRLKEIGLSLAKWPPFVLVPSLLTAEDVPSTVELLSLPYSFSQTGVLTESDFIRGAKERGVSLDRSKLEGLHRRGVLTPFFAIHSRPVESPRDLSPQQQADGVAWPIYRAAALGRLRDPGQTRFRPWSASRSHYYSHYQLLATLRWGEVLDSWEVRAGERLAFPEARLYKRVVAAFSKMRSLAVLLEAISPRYRPALFNVLRSASDDLFSFISERNPAKERGVLDIDPSLLAKQADVLLAHARGFDPLGEWRRVVRVGVPRRWEDLRFDARVAHEYRVAAELILRYYEDLADQELAPSLPALSNTWWEPRRDRLQVDHHEQAETILDFGLGDQPALVIAVEGNTEYLLAPRVLDLLGIPSESGFYEIVNLKSVDGDVRLLARSRAVPRVDPNGHIGARLLRSLTALVVIADPEHGYSTRAEREDKRQAMVDEVMFSLPPALQTGEMRGDLEHLIHVRTWGPSSFEYAHFTDTELARAIRSLGASSAPPLRELAQRIGQHRAQHQNIEKVWANWRLDPPSKPRLAEALWPHLRSLIQAPPRTRRIPIKSLLEEAIELAHSAQPVRELRINS
jgi:hypothetical protein